MISVNSVVPELSPRAVISVTWEFLTTRARQRLRSLGFWSRTRFPRIKVTLPLHQQRPYLRLISPRRWYIQAIVSICGERVYRICVPLKKKKKKEALIFQVLNRWFRPSVEVYVGTCYLLFPRFTVLKCLVSSGNLHNLTAWRVSCKDPGSVRLSEQKQPLLPAPSGRAGRWEVAHQNTGLIR